MPAETRRAIARALLATVPMLARAIGASVRDMQERLSSAHFAMLTMLSMLIAVLATIVFSPSCITTAQEQPSPNAIIFTRLVEGVTHLFAADPDGTNVVALDRINDSFPSGAQEGDLSPDGTTLVFSAASNNPPPPGGRPVLEIYSYNFATDSLTQLTGDGLDNFQPLWSPDGTRIAYFSHGENRYLNVMEVATRQITNRWC